MKLLNLIFIIFISLFLVGVVGLINAYNDRKIERAFEKGVAVGKRSMQPHPIDSLSLTVDPNSKMIFDSGTKKETTETYLKHLATKIIVDSIEFKYDSIMVIHYNTNEVK